MRRVLELDVCILAILFQQKLYKEQYETSVKGKPTVSMDMPHFIQAQKANDLISEVRVGLVRGYLLPCLFISSVVECQESEADYRALKLRKKLIRLKGSKVVYTLLHFNSDRGHQCYRNLAILL